VKGNVRGKYNTGMLGQTSELTRREVDRAEAAGIWFRMAHETDFSQGKP